MNDFVSHQISAGYATYLKILYPTLEKEEVKKKRKGERKRRHNLRKEVSISFLLVSFELLLRAAKPLCYSFPYREVQELAEGKKHQFSHS